MATGAENGAREVGMVAGSCGARYPAWPRVWMGQGLEPASNMDGGEVRAGDVELMDLAVGESVAQQGEGGDLPAEVAAGRDSLAGGRRHLQQRGDAAEDQGAGCGGLAVEVEMKLAAIEGGCEQMPLAGSEVCGAGELVVLAHPERDLAGIDGEIARVLGGGAAHAGDEFRMRPRARSVLIQQKRDQGESASSTGSRASVMGTRRPRPSARKLPL